MFCSGIPCFLWDTTGGLFQDLPIWSFSHSLVCSRTDVPDIFPLGFSPDLTLASFSFFLHYFYFKVFLQYILVILVSFPTPHRPFPPSWTPNFTLFLSKNKKKQNLNKQNSVRQKVTKYKILSLSVSYACAHAHARAPTHIQNLCWLNISSQDVPVHQSRSQGKGCHQVLYVLWCSLDIELIGQFSTLNVSMWFSVPESDLDINTGVSSHVQLFPTFAHSSS